MELIDSLREIKVATKIIDEAKEATDIYHTHYSKLNCNIEHIEKTV